MTIECLSVHFSYASNGNRHKTVLNSINHCFPAGQSALITGPTGSGKSTLLHLMAGLVRPDRGRIVADGQQVSRWISHHVDLWRRKVGIVFQEPFLLPDLTVVENVAAPLIPLRKRRHEVNKMAFEILDRLDLDHLTNQPAGLLSGGERQRLTLARALIVRPDYLFADEPTAFQDQPHTAMILRLIADERDRGTCVIVCSHDRRLFEAEAFDVVLRLSQGRLESL